MFTYKSGQFPIYSILKVLPTSTPKNTAVWEKNRNHTQFSLLPVEYVLLKFKVLIQI